LLLLLVVVAEQQQQQQQQQHPLSLLAYPPHLSLGIKVPFFECLEEK